MVVRASLALSVAWSLAVLPALCAAGLLEHICPCEEAACNHECGCNADPCDQVVSSTNQVKPEREIIATASPAVATPTVVDDDAEPPLIQALLHLSVAHSLRCFDSDMPLLN
jgi:hypothetical protein